MSAAPDLSGMVRGRMPVLDGWRGAAILIVVVHNAGFLLYDLGEPTSLTAIASAVLASGWVGVQLFFVLSGFLITGILLDTQGARHFLRDFYIRRTLRIFPLYYGFLGIVLLLGPLLVGPGAWSDAIRSDQLWYWLYLANWKPLLASGVNGLQHVWSLAVEEQFYVLWPLLLVLFGRRRFPGVVLVVLVGAPAARVYMYASGLDPEYLYYFTVARADSLAVGAAMAIAARSSSHLGRFWPHRWSVVIGASIAVLIVLLTSKGFDQAQPSVLLYGQTLIAYWFGGLMLVSLAPQGPVSAGLRTVLNTQWLHGLGKYSYAIYVFHFPLSQYLRPYVVDTVGDSVPVSTRLLLVLLYCAAILVLSTAMAYASWHMYEKHLLKLKERLAPRRIAAARTS